MIVYWWYIYYWSLFELIINKTKFSIKLNILFILYKIMKLCQLNDNKSMDMRNDHISYLTIWYCAISNWIMPLDIFIISNENLRKKQQINYRNYYVWSSWTLHKFIDVAVPSIINMREKFSQLFLFHCVIQRTIVLEDSQFFKADNCWKL